MVRHRKGLRDPAHARCHLLLSLSAIKQLEGLQTNRAGGADAFRQQSRALLTLQEGVKLKTPRDAGKMTTIRCSIKEMHKHFKANTLSSWRPYVQKAKECLLASTDTPSSDTQESSSHPRESPPLAPSLASSSSHLSTWSCISSLSSESSGGKCFLGDALLQAKMRTRTSFPGNVRGEVRNPVG